MFYAKRTLGPVWKVLLKGKKGCHAGLEGTEWVPSQALGICSICVTCVCHWWWCLGVELGLPPGNIVEDAILPSIKGTILCM